MMDLLYRGYLTGAMIVFVLLCLAFIGMFVDDLRNGRLVHDIHMSLYGVVWVTVVSVIFLGIITGVGTLVVVVVEAVTEVVA